MNRIKSTTMMEMHCVEFYSNPLFKAVIESFREEGDDFTVFISKEEICIDYDYRGLITIGLNPIFGDIYVRYLHFDQHHEDKYKLILNILPIVGYKLGYRKVCVSKDISPEVSAICHELSFSETDNFFKVPSIIQEETFPYITSRLRRKLPEQKYAFAKYLLLTASKTLHETGPSFLQANERVYNFA